MFVTPTMFVTPAMFVIPSEARDPGVCSQRHTGAAGKNQDPSLRSG
jgi:hypothetical protein